MTGIGGVHEAAPRLRDGRVPVDEPILCAGCDGRVWQDEAGAWEHAAAGDLRGTPVTPEVPEWIREQADDTVRQLNDGPLAGTGLTASYDLTPLTDPAGP